MSRVIETVAEAEACARSAVDCYRELAIQALTLPSAARCSPLEFSIMADDRTVAAAFVAEIRRLDQWEYEIHISDLVGGMVHVSVSRQIQSRRSDPPIGDPS